MSLCLFLLHAGVFHGYQQRNKTTVEQFLVADRSMSVIPVSFSLFVSWISAISFVADPVEAYNFGSVYMYMGLGYMLAPPLVALTMASSLHKFQRISIFEVFLPNKSYMYLTILDCI